MGGDNDVLEVQQRVGPRVSRTVHLALTARRPVNSSLGTALKNVLHRQANKTA